MACVALCGIGHQDCIPAGELTEALSGSRGFNLTSTGLQADMSNHPSSLSGLGCHVLVPLPSYRLDGLVIRCWSWEQKVWGSNPLSPVKPCQCLQNWYSCCYPAKCLAEQGQCLDCRAWCRFTVACGESKVDLQLLSQFSSMYITWSSSIPEIHCAGFWDARQSRKKTTTLHNWICLRG